MAVPVINVPIPILDPISSPARKEYRNRKDGKPDPLEGTVTVPWTNYFTQTSQQLNAAATRASVASKTSQAGAISATDMSGGGLTAGLYRISYYAQIIQAASVSSSLTVTLSWNNKGVLQSFSGAAITGNTTATNQFGGGLIRIDSVSPVNYATAYSSTGGTTMLYNLDVVLELVKI